MDSLLRDIHREQSKMRADVDNLYRHYEKVQSSIRQYIEQTTIEWAKLVAHHPRVLLLVVETIRVIDEHGYTSSTENEPIRFTALPLASRGEMWDQLLRPTLSHQVQGSEYHGLTMNDLEDKPRLAEAWPTIADLLEGRHILLFGADWARNALRTVHHTHALDDAFCLHNKCKEYYDEFYDLSLEKVLAYQGISKKREDLKDSRDRVLMLAQVVDNLAMGKTKQSEDAESFLDDLDSHPF